MRTGIVVTWSCVTVLLTLSCATVPGQNTAEAASKGAAAVVVRNLAQAGSFEVENGGPNIDLAPAVQLQQEVNGEWIDQVTDLRLIEKCGGGKAVGCVRLAHGAKLVAVKWNGLNCGSQCTATCRANARLGPGRFRVVVSSCDGKQKFVGKGFEFK